MPFCPNCGYEYEHNVAVCPDCDEKLVESLPDESENEQILSQYKDWVQMARLTSMQSANLVIEACRSKDLPAVLLSGAGHFGQTGQMGPSTLRAVDGGYSIIVPRKFVVAADIEGLGVLGDEWEKSRLIDIKEP